MEIKIEQIKQIKNVTVMEDANLCLNEISYRLKEASKSTQLIYYHFIK